MIKFFIFAAMSATVMANDLRKGGILDKVKSRFCDCKTYQVKREVDIQLFHKPYLKDSFTAFAQEEFGDLERLISFSKVKIIFRVKF